MSICHHCIVSGCHGSLIAPSLIYHFSHNAPPAPLAHQPSLGQASKFTRFFSGQALKLSPDFEIKHGSIFFKNLTSIYIYAIYIIIFAIVIPLNMKLNALYYFLRPFSCSVFLSEPVIENEDGHICILYSETGVPPGL